MEVYLPRLAAVDLALCARYEAVDSPHVLPDGLRQLQCVYKLQYVCKAPVRVTGVVGVRLRLVLPVDGH